MTSKMSRASRFINKIDEVNPFKLGRENVKDMTIKTVAKDITAIKDEIEATVDEFVPDEDDPKANRALKKAVDNLNKALLELEKVKR